MNYQTVPLSNNHKRKDFNCEKRMLDRYLHEQATQDVKRSLSACFVLEGDDETVKGYYTLSGASIKKELVPDSVRKKMPPSYSDLPVTLLGRLAVDKTCQGQGIGELLLIDALFRSYETSKIIGSIAVVVDPLDEDAVRFYKKYGFITLPDSGKMFLPMKSIEQLFVH